jgi:hypothetical protein
MTNLLRPRTKRPSNSYWDPEFSIFEAIGTATGNAISGGRLMSRTARKSLRDIINITPEFIEKGDGFHCNDGALFPAQLAGRPFFPRNHGHREAEDT